MKAFICAALLLLCPACSQQATSGRELGRVVSSQVIPSQSIFSPTVTQIMTTEATLVVVGAPIVPRGVPISVWTYGDFGTYAVIDNQRIGKLR